MPRVAKRLMQGAVIAMLAVAGSGCTGSDAGGAGSEMASDAASDTASYAALDSASDTGDADPAAGPIGSPAAFGQESSRPLPDDMTALGLRGENKPNGLQYRLRQSVPANTPAFIPRQLGGLELWIADPQPQGWLAFFRTPLEEAGQAGAQNARFLAVLLSTEGEQVWEVELNEFLSRPDHLEIQDIRLRDGELYINEGCQSYAREADSGCSALVRIDPRAGTEVWRTPPLISNDIFLVHDRVVIAGYGFTAEPDSLYLVSRESGEILDRAGLDSAHDYLEVNGDRLTVVTSSRVYEFVLEEP